MSYLIDSLTETSVKIGDGWYWARPINTKRLRIKDAIGVLFGKYDAVFKEIFSGVCIQCTKQRGARIFFQAMHNK